MAYCSNCGSQLEEDAEFCTVCGKKVTKLQKPEPEVIIYDGVQTASTLDTGSLMAQKKGMKSKKHKVDKIVNLICIIISIPGTIAGPILWLNQSMSFRGLTGLEAVNSATITSQATEADSEMLVSMLFNLDLLKWSYIVALIALVISTITVHTIWKMFRAGGKAFVVLLHAPVIIWIFTVGAYFVVPLAALFAPFVLGCMVPGVPILICTLNKHAEWNREG